MTKKPLIKYIVGISSLTVFLSGMAFADNDISGVNNSTEVHASTTVPRLPIIGGMIQNIKKEMGNDRLEIASTTQQIKDAKERIASTTKNLRGELKDERKDIRLDMERRRQNLKLIQMARVVWIRINATIVRLGKIVSKLDTRIAKVKTAGGDTTIAETNSALAKTALTTAKSDVDAIKAIILSISSTTPPDSIATSTIKADAKDAEMQIKTAQSDIEKALQSLRGLKIELKVNTHASTTESVETH